jgi:tetratricopeptide (TPR) repeat protein
VLAAGSLFLAVSHGEALRLGLRDDLYPVAAMAPLAALTSVVPGPAPIKIFALHRWGGYLTWNLPPRFKLFIDGRQLVYGPRLFEEYCRITMAAPNASALLARYAPDVVLVEHDSGVAGLLASTRTYALVHWDDACRMYVRRAAVPAAWLRAHTFLAAVPNPAPGGSPNTILGELDRAAAESPADARPWVIRADLLAQLGRLDEAGRAAGEAVRRRPEAIPALLSACRIAALRHATAAAEGFAASAERSDRTAAAPQLALARLAIDRGDHATAERRLATAIRLGNSATVRLERPDPAVHDGWALRAAEAGVTGHRVDAANAWREAGNASYRAGDLGEALRCYRAGLAADPANARLLHNLAATLTGLHRTAEARTAWERVRAVNPADADARHILTPEAPPARQ